MLLIYRTVQLKHVVGRCGSYAIALYLRSESCISASMISMSDTQLQYSSSSGTEGLSG